MSPTPDAEIIPPGATGASASRTTLYGLLAVLVAAGAWVRFNNQIASVSPQIAAPAHQAAEVAAGTRIAGSGVGAVPSVVELAVVSKADEPAAVAGLGLPAGEAAQLTAALQRDRIRLVQLPLFDAGAALPDGTDGGRSVMVSTAGFSRLVPLGRQPVVVTLPINRAGTISFTTSASGADPIGVGALTMNGPVKLPDLARGQELDVGVVAQ